jgi:hypothetical protein
MKRRPAAPLQTARFSVVVGKCGRPSVHLTLTAPAKDPALRRLESQGRVMTILPAPRGAGTDHGLVGIHPAPGVQLFIFPRSVRRFAGKRVVGINYTILDEDLHVTGRTADRGPHPKKQTRPPPKPAPLLPTRAPAPAPEKDRPAPEPPTLPAVLRRLRAIERLFDQKRPAAARDETSRLVQDLAQGLEPAKRRSSQ